MVAHFCRFVYIHASLDISLLSHRHNYPIHLFGGCSHDICCNWWKDTIGLIVTCRKFVFLHTSVDVTCKVHSSQCILCTSVYGDTWAYSISSSTPQLGQIIQTCREYDDKYANSNVTVYITKTTNIDNSHRVKLHSHNYLKLRPKISPNAITTIIIAIIPPYPDSSFF